MRKFKVFLIGILVLTFLNTCKQFLKDPEEDFYYWTASVYVKKADISGLSLDKEGYPYIVPENNRTISLEIFNDKNQKIREVIGLSSYNDIVVFEKGVTGADGINPPKAGVDYTLKQISQNKLELKFSKEFLQRSEWGSRNLNPTITLYNKEGKKFSQTYKFKLRANTPPPALEYKATGKVQSTDGKWYYVLCFQAPAAEMTKTIGTELLHKDIAQFVIGEQGGSRQEISLTINSSGTDFDGGGSNGFLLSVGSVTGLTSTDVPPGVSLESLPSGAWIICLKTDVEVKVGGTKNYTVQLRDEKGLVSTKTQKSTPENTVKDVTIALDANTGIQPTPPINLGQPNDPNTRYEIKSKQNVSSITLNASTATAGATIKYKLNSGSEQSGAAISLLVPTTGSTDYTLEVWAEKPGLNVGAHKTIYYRVTNTVYHTVTFSVEGGTGGTLQAQVSGQPASTSGSINVPDGGSVTFTAQPASTADERWEVESWSVDGTTVSGQTNPTYTLSPITGSKTVRVTFKQTAVIIKSSDTNAWKKLKEAVENSRSINIITIDGKITATNGSENKGEITISRPLTIKGADKNTDKLDAANHSYIFHVRFNGCLTLENLTLQNGNNMDSSIGGGGAIFCQGGSVTAKNITITACTAAKGGGIYARASNGISLSGNSTIENCTATGSDEQGGAVYVENSTFTIKDGTRITPSSGVFENVPGKNDVYLKTGQKITVDGTLTATAPIARITPESYSSGIIVAAGTSSFTLPADYVQKFVITPYSNANENWSVDKSVNDLILKDYGVFTIAATAAAGDSVKLSWKENGVPKNETISNQAYTLKLGPSITEIKLAAQCSSTTFLKEWTLTGGGTPPSGYTVIYPDSTNLKGKIITAVFSGRDSLPVGLTLSDDGKTIKKYTGTDAIIDLNAIGLGCIEEIGRSAFRNGSPPSSFTDNTTLKEVVLPNSLKTLGSYAFFDCKALKKVTIPKDFTGDINEVFPGCTDLEEYVITADNPRYCLSTNGHLCSKKETASGSYDPNDLTLVSVVFKPLTHPTLKIQDSRIKEIKKMAAEFHTFNKIEITGLAALSKIYQYAFFKSGGGYEVTIDTAAPPALPEQPPSVFGGATKIKVPSGSVNAYKTAWPNYADIIESY